MNSGSDHPTTKENSTTECFRNAACLSGADELIQLHGNILLIFSTSKHPVQLDCPPTAFDDAVEILSMNQQKMISFSNDEIDHPLVKKIALFPADIHCIEDRENTRYLPSLARDTEWPLTLSLEDIANKLNPNDFSIIEMVANDNTPDQQDIRRALIAIKDVEKLPANSNPSSVTLKLVHEKNPREITPESADILRQKLKIPSTIRPANNRPKR